MQIFVYMAVLLIGFSLNFGWDRLVRRRRARELGGQRREARPRALPPALAEDEHTRRLPDPKLRAFVSLTRATFTELDTLIDHFDLLLLRARDRARFGVVSVHADAPRRRVRGLLEGWLVAWAAVDVGTREQLESFALGPETVVEVTQRERQRTSVEFRRDTAPVLNETITDLDRAVIHMQGIVGLLEAEVEDPYR